MTWQQNIKRRYYLFNWNVTNRAAAFAAVKKGWKHFGRIDVAINVAGFSLYSAIEEMTEHEAREQMETNLFGALWVTQAVLPIMRSQGKGHIIQVSSMGGVVAFPTLGLYHASKWGLEGFSESLAQEVRNFGIRVSLIEPGVYQTSPDDKPHLQENVIAAYDEVRQALSKQFKAQKGDPKATVKALFKIIDEPDPPLRLILGTLPYPVMTNAYAERMKTWEKWKDVSDAAQQL